MECSGFIFHQRGAAVVDDYQPGLCSGFIPGTGLVAVARAAWNRGLAGHAAQVGERQGMKPVQSEPGRKASSRAAQMKSFKESPPMEWVLKCTVQRL